MMLRYSKVTTGSHQISMFIAAFVFLVVLGLQIYHPSKAEAAITGSGNAQDPYVISSCTDLQNIGTNGGGDLDALYYLGGDISCSASIAWNGGKGFKPIENFRGTLDGRGHTISGLHINRPNEDEVGLFSYLSDAIIANIAIDYTSTITGKTYVGSITGQTNNATFTGISSEATVDGQDSVGGLIGYSDGVTVQRSEFKGVASSDGAVGGLIGMALYGYNLSDVMVNSNISGPTAGGIIGNANQSCGDRYINNAAAYGTVDGTSQSGGLIGTALNQYCGMNVINNSYANTTQPTVSTNGGIIGWVANTSITINNTFYEDANVANCIGLDEDATINSTCADIGTNVPTSDAPYSSWNYTDIWEDNSGIENLQWPFDDLEGPTVPQSLSIVQGANERALSISWTASTSSGTYDLSDYQVQTKRHSDTWAATLDDYTADYNTLTVDFSNYKLGTDYDIRVRAITSYAKSAWVTDEYSTPAANTVSISTCQQLQDFDNDADNIWNNISLTADINCAPDQLGGNNFEPLGASVEWNNDYFRGDFDGNEHVISGMVIDYSSWGVGLFKQAYLSDMHDVEFDGGSVANNQGLTGVLVGYAENSSIYNVISNVPVTGNYYAGGIAGEVDFDNGVTRNISNLISSGDIIAPDYTAGGIFGDVGVYDPDTTVVMSGLHASGTVNANYGVGGLFGEVYVENSDDYYMPSNSLLIEDSSATGNAEGIDNIGGIVGYAETYNEGYGSSADMTFQGVYATGDVTATDEAAGGLIGELEVNDPGNSVTIDNSYTTGEIIANDQYAGGLIGRADVLNQSNDDQQASTLDITNSYATGDVKGSDDIGGLIGFAELDSDGYYNSPGIINIDLSFATGNVTTDEEGDYINNAGGIIGYAEVYSNSNEVNITRTYSSGNVIGDEDSDCIGGIAGYVYVNNSDDNGLPEASFSVSDSFATGDISGGYAVGGIIGENELYNDGYIDSLATTRMDNVYSAGDITAAYDSAGGLIGYQDGIYNDDEVVWITNSFAAGHIAAETNGYGLIGADNWLNTEGGIQMYNSYFVEGEGQPTQAFYNMGSGWDTFSNDNVFKGNSTHVPFKDGDDQMWDFDDIWLVVDGNYPSLRSLPSAEEEPTPDPEPMLDVNGDGIDDSTQPYIVGFINGISGKQQAIELSDSCTIDGDQVAVKQENQFTIQDAGFDYGSSFVSFAANCSASTINVKLYYYDLSGIFTARKHNPGTGVYFSIPGAATSTTTINGHNVLVVSYQIQDNGDLDLNKADNEILDPVGLGTQVVGAPNTGFKLEL